MAIQFKPAPGKPQKTKAGRPTSGGSKTLISIRISTKAADYYRALGKDWQAILRDDIDQAMKRRSSR